MVTNMYLNFIKRGKNRRNEERKNQSERLTTGLFWMLRARFAYFKVLRVSSALISAGLMQAEKG